MDPLDLTEARRRRLDELEAVPALGLQQGLDRPDPAGVLGVRAGVVLEREGVAVIERHRQIP